MRALNSIKAMPSYKVRIRQAALSIATLVALGGATISADATELYVDTETKQVFTVPGVNRVKLSEFEEVNAVVGKIPPEEVKALETKLRQKKKMDEAQAQEELTAPSSRRRCGPTPSACAATHRCVMRNRSVGTGLI